MGGKIRWGIAGTGDIARQFAADLRLLEGAELAAVGSRAQHSADRFADTHGIPRRHASYEALADDPAVDVVYVASPHTQHKANTLLFLERGKHVLCEKPIAMNASETDAMIAAARERGLFLMEAMWTYCFPAIRKLNALLREGAIGTVRMVTAAFFYQAPYTPDSRLFNLALGGGSLLDLGVYPVALAQLALPGTHHHVASAVRLGETGVDEEVAITLRHEDGALAVLSSGLRVNMPQEAVIAGTAGFLRIPHFSQPNTLVLDTGDRQEMLRFAPQGYGYSFEAAEVMRCLQAGETESPLVPLENTRARMRLLDEVRQAAALRYPME